MPRVVTGAMKRTLGCEVAREYPRLRPVQLHLNARPEGANIAHDGTSEGRDGVQPAGLMALLGRV